MRMLRPRSVFLVAAVLVLPTVAGVLPDFSGPMRQFEIVRQALRDELWAIAARRACVLADMAARFAVSVVPMFSPITRAIPWKIEIAPVEQSTMVMAISAADDCAMQVRTAPMSRNSRIVQ